MKQTVKHSVVKEKGEVLETFASNSSNLVRHYFRNMWNPTKYQSHSVKLWLFVEIFAKILAIIEYLIEYA